MTESSIVNVPDISIVVPVYGCDGTLAKLYQRVCAAVTDIPASFELIFIDDCGPGRPWELIKELARQDPRVIGLKLSRNFGQHYAITAGVDFSQGNWLVVMDCDLQDRPEEIPHLWVKAQEGFDVVVGRRVERQDVFWKRLASNVFHRIFSYMTDQASDATQANFGIYSRKVVDDLKRLPEHSRAFPLLIRWLGFKSTSIEIQHDERADGKSSYNLSRMFSLATDAIVSYSNKPLKIFVQTGFLIAFSALFYGVWLIIRYLSVGYVAPGWTSVMVSLYFLSGVLLFGMGVLGIYIGRIFNQVKGRPLYIVQDITRV
jgi:polyisoprenyl-phosphate glycosyltransferase